MVLLGAFPPENAKIYKDRVFRYMLDIIQAYENYLVKVKQASDNTISSYMRDIRQFSEWMLVGGCSDIVNATQVNIRRSERAHV